MMHITGSQQLLLLYSLFSSSMKTLRDWYVAVQARSADSSCQ